MDNNTLLIEIEIVTNRLTYVRNRLEDIQEGRVAGELGERDYLEEMIGAHQENINRLNQEYETTTGKKLWN